MAYQCPNSAQPATLACPRCGAKLTRREQRQGLVWACASGHCFPTTRSLLRELLASGWSPRIERR